MELKTALYLVPSELSHAPLADVLPAGNLGVVRELRHFIVENLRSARRFLRRWDPAFPIDECSFHELNTHTDRAVISGWLDPLRQGTPLGRPRILAIAQKEGLQVIPLVGPSSILLALMASGFNGQGFAFNGYLPQDPQTRRQRIIELGRPAARTGQTQIFIETPYRNNAMVKALAEALRPDTLLCVAADITDPDAESIRTRAAAKWRTAKYDYDKRPVIFLIHVPQAAPPAARKGGGRR